MPDQLTAAILAEALQGHPFRFFERIGSTNDAALEWALAGAPAGAVVVADEQTTGRGRMGRRWYTPPGQALALSVVLRPCIEPPHLQRITMLGGLAVSETLAEYVSEGVAIKWPNDVLLHQYKVCGVLSEVLWVGERLDAVILGIGINFNIDFSGMAIDATSLHQYTTQPVRRLDVLTKLLSRIDYWMDHLEDDSLLDGWRRQLITLGQYVRIPRRDGVLEGIADDVDELGALVIIDDAGQRHHIVAGDVWHVG